MKDLNVAFEYEVESVLQKDGLEMTETDRAIIRRQIEKEVCERIVITHGTDTMVETAKSLLGIRSKTVVLTGATEPARSRYADAIFFGHDDAAKFDCFNRATSQSNSSPT